MNRPLKTPVVLLFWKRPEKTTRVMEAIRRARPRELFLVADGPRAEQEKNLCQETRQLVEKMIDWDCQVYKNYAEKNLGCRVRVASGIDWALQKVERAIILEDDCLPHPDFFDFCQELLEKYENNERVMHIGGTNTEAGNKNFQCADSYYFSQIAQIWGWATWRRAWQKYDVDVKSWPAIKTSELWKRVLPNFAVREYWTNLIEEMYQNKNPHKNTWDAQWFYTVLINKGLAITPRVNLITNIGFDEAGTHALSGKDEKANLAIGELAFPLEHPAEIKINKQADRYNWKFVFRINNGWKKKTKSFWRHWAPGWYGWVKRILT